MSRIIDNITAFSWLAQPENEPMDLNVAVKQENCIELAEMINGLEIGDQVKVNCLQLPETSPQHVDDPNLVLRESRSIFTGFTLKIISKPVYEIAATIEDGQLFLDYPKLLLPGLSAALIESRTSGYIRDNYIDVSLLTEKCKLIKTSLYFWGCNGSAVIYY